MIQGAGVWKTRQAHEWWGGQILFMHVSDFWPGSFANSIGLPGKDALRWSKDRTTLDASPKKSWRHSLCLKMGCLSLRREMVPHASNFDCFWRGIR